LQLNTKKGRWIKQNFYNRIHDAVSFVNHSILFIFEELKMNSLNKIVLLSVLLLCTAHVFSMDIFSAVETGNADMVQELIGQDQRVVNQQDAIGFTPLLRAAYKGNPEIVRLLLRAGAEVNKRNRAGRTPLYLAVNSRNPEIVRMLLDKGAEVNKQNNDGWTPLYWAACIRHTEIVRVLLAAGAKVNIQDSDGWTPLLRAAGICSPEIVRMLLDKGAEVNIQDNGGRTPLHWAAGSHNTEGAAGTVSVLLEAGAKVNIQDNGGRTPLHWAAAAGKGKDEIVKILRDAMRQQARRREIASALALATHPGLGEVGPAALLSQDLMANIARLAEWSER
jgi:hypothetical protein